ncbi:MAG: hypothetical protein AAF610_04380 [Pseudomonadota bacterium]
MTQSAARRTVRQLVGAALLVVAIGLPACAALTNGATETASTETAG